MRKLLLSIIGTVGLSASASAVTMDWIQVGAPGNAADTTGFGAVNESYLVSQHEVTNAQYAEFLNAVAASDPNGLFANEMATNPLGGIDRSGTAGSFNYSTRTGRENRPVNFVSFYDAIRFANWMHNGQGSGSTEDGAYTITASGIANNTITRNAGATIFLPSEDEWYKAAYFDALSSSYFDFPAGSDAPTACAAPTSAANSANCDNVVALPTDVGSYPGSPSPFGTFDQGGNVTEWTEGVDGLLRVTHGGDFRFDRFELEATSFDPLNPSLEADSVGFRIAAIPEPGTGLTLSAGLVALGLLRARRMRGRATA